MNTAKTTVRHSGLSGIFQKDSRFPKAFGVAGMTVALFVFMVAFTGQARAADICFSQDTAGRMVVELEQCRVDQQTMTIMSSMIENLKGQAAAQQDVIKAQEEKIAASEKTIAKMEKLLNEQAKQYEEQIEASKPSFFQEALKGAGYVAAGIIIGVLVLH
jgi:hypothetical protein